MSEPQYGTQPNKVRLTHQSRNTNASFKSSPGMCPAQLLLDSTDCISSLEGSSRDEPPRLFPCLDCHLKCRRSYDVIRHYQTKHKQSEHWFCPVRTCELSGNVEPLEALESARTRYEFSHWLSWPLLKKTICRDARLEYCKFNLYGFPRKDKLLSHFKKAHRVISKTV